MARIVVVERERLASKALLDSLTLDGDIRVKPFTMSRQYVRHGGSNLVVVKFFGDTDKGESLIGRTVVSEREWRKLW